MGVVDHGERATALRQLLGDVRGHVAVTWHSGEDVGEGGHQRLAGDEGLVEHAREGEHRQPVVRVVCSHSAREERAAVAACRSPRHMGRCGRVRARLPLRSSAISSRMRVSLFSPNLRGSKPRSPGFRDLSANIVFMLYAPQFDQISMSETKTRICAAERRVSDARAERRAGRGGAQRRGRRSARGGYAPAPGPPGERRRRPRPDWPRTPGSSGATRTPARCTPSTHCRRGTPK